MIVKVNYINEKGVTSCDKYCLPDREHIYIADNKHVSNRTIEILEIHKTFNSFRITENKNQAGPSQPFSNQSLTHLDAIQIP